MRLFFTIGGVLLLLVATAAVWVRDEPPADFTDLEPRYRFEVPEGAPTVVDRFDALFAKPPKVPPRIEELQWELNHSLDLSSSKPFPVSIREDEALREALRAFRKPGADFVRLLESSLQIEHFGPNPNPWDWGYRLEITRYGDFERAMFLAAWLEGETAIASLAYGRMLCLIRRWRDEGAVSTISLLLCSTFEEHAWRSLEVLRWEGSLDQRLEREWLSYRAPTPPDGIDTPESLRQAFQWQREMFRDFDSEEDSLFSRLTFKKNRTLRLLGEETRRRIARAELSAAERRTQIPESVESSRLEMLFNNEGKEFLELQWDLDSMLESLDRTTMVREAGRLLLAFDRYQRENGTLPETIEALRAAIPELVLPIDPYSGKPFLYDPDRRIFWSVGEDGASQGATVMPDRAGGVDPWSLVDPTWVIPEVVK